MKLLLARTADNSAAADALICQVENNCAQIAVK